MRALCSRIVFRYCSGDVAVTDLKWWWNADGLIATSLASMATSTGSA